MTDEVPGCAIKMVSDSDVTMNRIAATVVALVNKVAVPREPKVVWLPPPPKAPDQSAAFPCCSNTTKIRKMQTMTCTIVKKIIIGTSLSWRTRPDRDLRLRPARHQCPLYSSKPKCCPA